MDSKYSVNASEADYLRDGDRIVNNLFADAWHSQQCTTVKHYLEINPSLIQIIDDSNRGLLCYRSQHGEFYRVTV